MNMRADVPRPSSAASRIATAPLPASLVPLSPGVSAVVFDAAQLPKSGERPRLTARLDGTPLTRPMISTSLDLAAGGQRHVLLIGRDAQSLAAHRIDLALGIGPVAVIDPDWLQPALADGAALMDGLSDAGRRRLLKLFLTTGASLFGRGEGPAFAAAARDLMELMGVRTARFVACCPVGQAGHVVSYDLALAPEDCVVGELVALDGLAMRRIVGFRQRVETSERGARLHLFLAGSTVPAAPLVSIGAAPILLPATEPETILRPIVPWLEQASDSLRAWLRDLIIELAPQDRTTASLLHELRHTGDAPPAVTIEHLSATAHGVLVSITLADPHLLIRGIQVERGEATALLPAAEDGWPNTRHARYLALPRPDWRSDVCRIRLLYRSGRLHTVEESTPAPFDGALPTGWEPEDAPAIAAARRDRDTGPAPRRVVTFGALPAAAPLAILVAVGDNLDLIRARAAMHLREPGSVELIYHTPEGPLARAAQAAIAAAQAIYGLPHKLVLVPAGTAPSASLLAGLAEAGAAAVLLLGADILPAGPGWLAPLRRAARSGAPMLAPLLLGADGAVRSVPDCLGLPAEDLPPALGTSLLSADCLLLTRAGVEMLAAFTRPYPNPDIVLAEAAARLDALGSPVRTHPRSRFVRYREPSAPSALERAVDAAALRLQLGNMVRGEVSE